VTAGTQELRFRPLGRGTFIGGFFVTLLIHFALFGLVWYGSIKAPAPEEKTRDILITETVRLGKPREKFWLPRIVQPPPPKVEEPVIKVTENLEAPPAEKKEEEKKPEKKPDLSKKVQDVLNRRRAMFQNATEEPEEGLATGSKTGTSNVATEGDPYLTAVVEAIKRNWSVPRGLSLGMANNLEAEMKISIGDDGQILSSSVRKSSGNALYDDACLQAIQATRTVPPPPADRRARMRRGIALVFDGKDLAR
jgi:TonB family protein